MRKSIAIIGLGRFGLSLVKHLSRSKVDVIAIDTNPKAVNEAANYVSQALICDSTNENGLKEIGVQNVDHAIIALGQNDPNTIVTTIVTTILLKNLGVPLITVRLDNPYYEKTLYNLGATSIFSPLEIAGEKLATKVASNSLIDYYNITDGFNVFDLVVGDSVTPISLIDLEAPRRWGVNIILIKRNGKAFVPKAQDELCPKDHVFAFGKDIGVAALDTFLHDLEEEKRKETK
ncbi:MAG: TrkA family potassium uptake protein [Bacilli bacterium]|nr:TrkA family potassium uptake protein [Bacilli bacterium]